MNDIFNLEGPFFTILSKFCDMLILSICWTLFSIPVVTIGPATSALYHTIHNSFFQNRGYIIATFWESFKSNFKQGIMLTLLCIPVGLFALISFHFSKSMGHETPLGILYIVVCVFCVLFVLIMFSYGFPTLSRFYMKFVDIIKSSVAFAITRAGFTILLLLILCICAFAFYVAPVSCFLIPACYTMASERLLEPAFQKAIVARDAALAASHENHS